MSRIRPKYTQGMNDVRRLLDKIGGMDINSDGKDWLTWTLLTALRGPDNENFKLKTYSTARLRAEITPNLAKGARAERGEGNLHQINMNAVNTERHFAAHFNLAIGSLEQIKRKGR